MKIFSANDIESERNKQNNCLPQEGVAVHSLTSKGYFEFIESNFTTHNDNLLPGKLHL